MKKRDLPEGMDEIIKRFIIWACFVIVFICAVIGLMIKNCSGQHEGVYQMIEAHNIDFPDVVYHQALLETGNFDSTLNSSWNCCNNAFGFFNGTRYLIYDNLEHCIEGYKAWQDWQCPDCKTKEEYYQCLFKNWGAPNMELYLKNLRKFEDGNNDTM